ncbi:MAG TPA: hypothetical protein VG826_21830 [Pirellulales bacterium]|nr:hypothetical protein [Pirellulales bacterium]
METAVQMVTAFGLVGSTAMLALVGVQLGRIRTELRRGVRVNVDGGMVASDTAHGGSGELPSGHAIFVYRNGQWHLETDFSKPGFEPSLPGIQGSYEGQAIKKPSVLKGHACHA